MASCWRRPKLRTANHWQHRANTDRSRLARRPNINQRFQPKQTPGRRAAPNSCFTRRHHAWCTVLQALGHCSTVSQSPKWPPRTQLSVIVSWDSARSRETRRPFKLTRHVIHNQDEHCSAPAQEEHIARGHAQFAATALLLPTPHFTPPHIYPWRISTLRRMVVSGKNLKNFPLPKRSTGRLPPRFAMNFPCPCCHRGSVVDGGSQLPSQTSDEFLRVCFHRWVHPSPDSKNLSSPCAC